MKVTATRPVWVESNGSKVLLKKGESAEVDGRAYSNSHMFIKAEYLVPSKAQPVDDDSNGDDAYRQQLMDSIEQATSKRPGVKTKTETLEKRWSEILADQKASGSGEGDQAEDEAKPEE